MYNYAIIIPHKNCPDLLQRALDSIPEKDDIQVIIVDDNSDATKVDFENFPGLGRKNTIVVFDKSGKGAGRARNIGLSKIENNTKWILFLDADDFFSYRIEEILEKYKNSESDIVFFCCDSVYSDTLKPADRHIERNKKITNAKGNKDLVRYKDYVPWGKIISYKIVKDNNLKFEELFVGNDTMFSVNLGSVANKIEISDDIIYVVTVRNNSLVHQKNLNSLISRYNTAVRVNSKMRELNKMKYRVNLFAIAFRFRVLGIGMLFKYMLAAIRDTSNRYIVVDIYSCIIAIISGKKIKNN